MKETNRLLLPHAFSRRPADGLSDAKPSRQASKTKPSPVASVVGATTTTPSPSAIKAAAKSAALQVTKQITQEEDDSDEEVAPENFFSLPDKAEPPGVEPYPYPVPTVPEEPPPGTELEPAFQDDAANAPLEFKMAAGSSGAPWAPTPGDDYGYSQFATYGDANAAGAYYQVGRGPARRRGQPPCCRCGWISVFWRLGFPARAGPQTCHLCPEPHAPKTARVAKAGGTGTSVPSTGPHRSSRRAGREEAEDSGLRSGRSRVASRVGVAGMHALEWVTESRDRRGRAEGRGIWRVDTAGKREKGGRGRPGLGRSDG